MRKNILVVLTLFVVALFSSYPNAQGDDSAAMQAKLESALSNMKKEIRTDVNVPNGGKITGTVKCSRVRHSGDAVVFLENVGDNKFDAPTEHGMVDQLNLIFVPHVMAVQRGTTVDFPNNDLVRHNVFSPPDCCNQFNLGTYDIGVSKPFTFNNSCEVPLLCNVHAEMSAYIVVLDNPYFAVTSRDGSFTIDNVPPGTYVLKSWHAKLKSVTENVTVESGQTAEVSLKLKKRK